MNPGQIIIILAFLSSLGAAFFYFAQGKKNERPQSSSIAGRLFLVSVGGGVIASLLMLYLLITNQFQYEYVSKYSSLDQPFIYLFSALWAGQEGTFLFWAMLVGIMGIVFMKSKNHVDTIALGVVNFFAAFLYLLMIVKSPFETVALVPPDGQGMNPLLMNPWMAIHPPILFIGYAATIFPFALVLSALARRSYDSWNERGFAWTLFATVMLGAGIIIGGFWAYEVLGWGGYWGWDPVENSSLVPWITLLALIHGLLLFKAKGAMQRTNMFLAIITFLLVLYATFLTRSGVLADFSVHSFVDLGINNYLVGIMVLGCSSGFGLLATRFRDIKSPKLNFSNLNREVALLFSLYVLLAAAAFTFAGMSSPIFTGLAGKASQVDISFYNKVNLPVAIAMALLLGITPFLGWSEETKSSLLKRYSMPLILTALSCVIAYVAGVTSTVLLVFVGVSAFALISNSIIAFRQYRSGWLTLGGPITHIGTALMLIGIIGSGNFDETKQIMLKQGEPKEVFGYSVLFKDFIEDPSKNEKPIVSLEVKDGNNTFKAFPKLYFSNYSQSIMREPDIKVFPLKDLYLSPLEMKAPQQHDEHPTLEIGKGEKKEFGGYEIEFVGFQTGEHGQPGSMQVGALLKVTSQGKETEVIPAIVVDAQGQQTQVPVEMPPLHNPTKGIQNPVITLAGMSVEQKKIMLAFHGLEGDDHSAAPVYELLLEVSIKPLMMVVWTGVVLIIAGTIIAFKRRLSHKESS
ncbi:MAG: cytochrome c biogenesis protein CcsA [Ignavibacteriae bacterium]|nr:cytochrome c biogenesis protein CcsA [Ignavibacteriota bacterium]